MKHRTRKPTVADRLTDQLTAFTTFAAFRAAMGGTGGRQGYVPTILGSSPSRQKLVRIVRGSGFKVYDGRRTA